MYILLKCTEVHQNPGQMIKVAAHGKGALVTKFTPEFIEEDVLSFSGSEEGQMCYGSTL